MFSLKKYKHGLIYATVLKTLGGHSLFTFFIHIYSTIFYKFRYKRWEKQSGSHLFNYLTISKTLAKSSNLQSAVKDILNLEVPSGTVGGRIAGM